MVRNATLIRSGLGQIYNPKTVAEKFSAHFHMDTNKAASPNLPVVNAWVAMNVVLNEKELKQALEQTYSSGYAFGVAQADEALGLVDGFDWNNWKAGFAAAAIRLKDPEGLQQVLAEVGITLNILGDTSLKETSRILAEAIDNGWGATKTAKELNKVVRNARRSMTIARTETTRAMSDAKMKQYKENNVPSKKWLVSDPCPICTENANAIVPINEEFPSGHMNTPAHPNCECAVAPSFDDVSQQFAQEVQQPVQQPPAEPMIVAPEEGVVHDGTIRDINALDEMPFKLKKPTQMAKDDLEMEITAIKRTISRSDVVKNYEQDLIHSFEEMAKNPLGIQVNRDTLEKIVADGGMKTMWERGSSGIGGSADFYLKARKKLEDNWFGIPEKTSDAAKPIYGHPHNVAHSEASEKRLDNVRNYGRITLILKDSVKGRASITCGDTLNNWLKPVLYKDILDGSFTFDELIGASKEAAMTRYIREYNDAQTSMVLRGEPKTEPKFGLENNDFSPENLSQGYEYWESQVYGGVSLDDIESIRLTMNDYELLEEFHQDLLDQLSELNISIFVEAN